MRQVITTDDYVEAVSHFPARAQALAKRQLELLAHNWRDSRLHVKKLRVRADIYSYRITRNYRALFYFDTADHIIVFKIDNRRDAYR